MFWDGLFVSIALILSINGWRRGLLGSWRGPIAMICTTLLVQRFYIDFSTWIMSKLRISPEASVFVGYLMLWFFLEAVIEITLALLIRTGKSGQPIFFNRAGGVMYGLGKACVIAILPFVVTSLPLKIPPPPTDKSHLILPVIATDEKDSFFIPYFRSIAKSLVPVIGTYVIADRAPSFIPVYETKSPEETERKGREGVPKQELDNLLDNLSK